MSADFRIDLGQLQRREKSSDTLQEAKLEAAADKHGFIPREAPKKRGRKPSPRTGQVHAKVLPHVSVEIAEEAKQRGVQQGVIIEEAWALYQAAKK